MFLHHLQLIYMPFESPISVLHIETFNELDV